MQANPTTTTAVQHTLDQLAEVYLTRDIALMRSLFADDPDVLMFSPAAGQNATGLSAIIAKAQSDWTKTDAASLTYTWTAISAAGSVAWAAAEADFSVTIGGQQTTFPVRITFVLEQRGDHWLILHAHYSFPAGPRPAN